MSSGLSAMCQESDVLDTLGLSRYEEQHVGITNISTDRITFSGRGCGGGTLKELKVPTALLKPEKYVQDLWVGRKITSDVR